MIKSRLTSKGQTTIPQPVRTALNLREGDEIAFEIGEGRATLTKLLPPAQVEDPFAVFDEWNSEADRQGYAKL